MLTLAVKRYAMLAVLASAPLGACTGLTARAERQARQSGFVPAIVQGDGYRHEIFPSPQQSGEPLYVFIEGDGSPWSADGRRVSADPTPRQPLALTLALQTPGRVLYLGRPCYFLARSDSACASSLWTFERYSDAVVASMVAVLQRYCLEHAIREVVLIGYSGGGTLAVLMAPRLSRARAVVTIAANLDVDAWTQAHHYLALQGMNPADQPVLTLPEWHLVADRDTVVPPSSTHRYLDRVSPAHVWHFANFDHACCWVAEWPMLLARIHAAIGPSLSPIDD